VIAITGLSQSAKAAVSATFNAQLATQVTFQDGEASSQPEVLSEASVARLGKLSGVIHAGLMWNVDAYQPLPVRRTALPDPGGQASTELPFTAASAGALATMHATVAYGRLYDHGFEARHEMVALLGVAAANQLGIADTGRDQAIFVGPTALTVIGVVGSVTQQDQALLGVIVPPYVASVISAGQDQRQVIVQTAPGAAQVIGRQGPLALSPFDPSRIDAQVPPDPKTLRQQVEASLNALLVVLAVVAFVIGLVAIANTTLLSVMQRRSEIGLRRAVGFRPIHIAALVLGEAALIGTIGGILGTSVGVVATAITAISRGWTPVLAWQIALAAPLLGTVAGVAAGIYPSVRASRITPLSALRSS
jgi:putative ABC transport system permease protein